MEHITLPALDDDGSVETREVLEVERVGPDRFRLLHSPAYVHGIAAGDVIALDARERSGFRVLERSGNLAVVLVLSSLDADPEDRRASVTAWVQSVGGTLDGGPPRFHVYSIPVTVGFAAIEARFDQFVSEVSDSAWWYGNVYDLSGEELLGWWRSDDVT